MWEDITGLFPYIHRNTVQFTSSGSSPSRQSVWARSVWRRSKPPPNVRSERLPDPRFSGPVPWRGILEGGPDTHEVDLHPVRQSRAEQVLWELSGGTQLKVCRRAEHLALFAASRSPAFGELPAEGSRSLLCSKPVAVAHSVSTSRVTSLSADTKTYKQLGEEQPSSLPWTRHLSDRKSVRFRASRCSVERPARDWRGFAGAFSSTDGHFRASQQKTRWARLQCQRQIRQPVHR